MKTAELTGAALDWAVSKASNPPGKEGGMDWWERDAKGYLFDPLNECTYSPSTDWAQGGPIIEREEISIARVGRSADDAMAPHPECWSAHIDGVFCRYGTTPLIAAMRCYVARKIGDTIEIPKELT